MDILQFNLLLRASLVSIAQGAVQKDKKQLSQIAEVKTSR